MRILKDQAEDMECNECGLIKKCHLIRIHYISLYFVVLCPSCMSKLAKLMEEWANE